MQPFNVEITVITGNLLAFIIETRKASLHMASSGLFRAFFILYPGHKILHNLRIKVKPSLLLIQWGENRSRSGLFLGLKVSTGQSSWLLLFLLYTIQFLHYGILVTNQKRQNDLDRAQLPCRDSQRHGHLLDSHGNKLVNANSMFISFPLQLAVGWA